ncbi:MAG: lysophospholipid acyltransferase family protein [Dehalococcoidales bacterium]|nr:lysophospholipid acyltransferase family protein [Dehalococcoidales bacterium]
MFYDLANLFARVLLWIVSRPKIVGLENVPQSGPLIVAANHINWLDPPVLGAYLPRRIRFMAKIELFQIPIVGWAVAGYEAFPVRRGERDRQAMQAAIEILREGSVLGMFPEGTRSKTATLQQGRAGAALLALRAGVPILPVGISGTQNVFRFPNILTRPSFQVNIGPVFNLSPVDIGSREDIYRAVDQLMLRIAALLPPEYRGVYSLAKDASKAS